MIARTLEWNLGDDQPAQRVGKKRPGRVKNGGMVKTGRARSRRRTAQALPGVKTKMVVEAARRDERGARPARGERKTQYTAIKIQRPLEVGDLQMHMANSHAGVDRGHTEGCVFDGYRLGHG